MAEANLTPEEQEIVRKEIQHREAVISREGYFEQLPRRAKVTIYDFISITIIGKGAFGEVRLVRSKYNNQVLAMKKMKKSEMIAKRQVNHVKAEKEVLAKSRNPWIVELKYSFQVKTFNNN
eukprot:TRINITY_DN2538_c0_g7_i1.p3 TRINITY_DN2538_c0_g7~~TRINITY_DN2538_c0_g7_i1.p3  ORF type:complete len:121 (-),score=30.99 TRINITY_DN2538_c0_g7_i1:1537-1899(-)